MAVGIFPPPICRPASCQAASSLLSLPSGTTTATSPPAPPALSMDEFNEKFFEEYGCDLTELLFTEEEVRVLMLEYEAEKAYLLSHGEVKETAPAEHDAQVPDAPRPSKKARGENGKAPPPPPGEQAENVEVQTPPPPPSPPREEVENVMFQTTPPPSHKKVAERILNRRFFPPDPSHGATILSCRCRELPRGSPRCALHQKAPFRSWMSEQGYVREEAGGTGWALVPKLSAECGRNLFQRYARWRRRVWMPTRFFLERAQPPCRTYKYHLQVLPVLFFQYMHRLEIFSNFCSSLVTFLLIEHLKKPHELLYGTHIRRSTVLKTTMAVGIFPPPICRPASCQAASSLLSLPSGTTTATSPPAPPALSMDEFNEKFFEEYGCDLTELLFTEEEVRVLMLEYEAEKAYLLSHGEVKETAPAEHDAQVPDAPRPSKKARGENGKAPPPPPGEQAENVEVQTPPPPPSPPREEVENVMFQTTPPPSHKKVAERILNRRFFPPDPSHGATILSCRCRELPRGSPRCALHQKAPFRSWMSEQGYVREEAGGTGWALVPKLSAECGRNLFQRYARWRRRVWMPTRFFLERAQPPCRT
uniref:Uncharacterized protein n=1 Tax=Oryza punctata TaxID=4537 RepID=A0A0E0LVL6_ORYPU